MASLVLSAVQELKTTTPLPDDELQKVVAAFVAGDPGLEVEIHCATAEKLPTWRPTQLPAVAELIRAHSSHTDLRVPDATENVKLQAGQLLAEEFVLLEKKVECDLRLVKAWAQKVRDRESQLYYQRLHHKEARVDRAKAGAEDFFDPNHRFGRFHIVDTDNLPSGKIFASIAAAVEDVSKRNRLEESRVRHPLGPFPLRILALRV